MSTVTAPASAREALDMVRAGLGYLAADPARLDPQTQALVLRELEHHDAVATAARAGCLAVFTAGQGHCADGDYSPRAWLMHQTGITRGAAAAHTAWARRAADHPRVLAALAARQVSESYARAICGWTGTLPEECREAADEILLAAAGQGLGLEDLASLAGEMWQRSRADASDPDEGKDFEDRAVTLAATFGGAGVIHGALTPECAAIVGTGTAGGPAGATSPRRRARCTTSGTRPTAGRPASRRASCCARSITRWRSTGGGGRWC